MTQIQRRQLIGAAAAGAAALALPTFVRAQSPIVIKFSHVVAPDTPKGNGAQRFKELAEKNTGGKVKVEIYPNSQLYKDKEEMEALQLGSVQMLAPSLAKFGPLGVEGIRGLRPALHLQGPGRVSRHHRRAGRCQELFKKLEPKGVKGLAYWDNGFHIMSANKPLHKVADFKGLKMRIQSSKVLDAEMRALGAIPQVMAFSRALPGAAVGRGRRLRRRALELLHAEDLRSAEAHHHLEPRPPRLRRHHQQEVLGRPARPTSVTHARGRAERRDRLRQRAWPTKENVDDLEKMRASAARR